MDQKELRELESRCIQEEPPECVAACPIHVDARSFIRCIVDDNWADARKILERTMPLPGILGRICDAPCRLRCKRHDIGGAIQVGKLERYCVANYAGVKPMMPVARKARRVAVIGSGVSSLTVAWDLARKGYPITLFEPGEKPGAFLLTAYPQRLTDDFIEAEITKLVQLSVRIETRIPVTGKEFFDRIINTFDAIYIGLDTVSDCRWHIGRDEDGSIQVSPKLQTTSIEKVFAGGRSLLSEISPVWQAAEGRIAATSIDRALHRVSMTAGREKEGPFATRLFTDTSRSQYAEVITPADSVKGYTLDEAVREAGRCLLCECLECVKVCVYLERFGAYPKKYAREIYNNESLVMGTRTANKLINSCSLCGLCETVCPEDFAVQDLCLSARQRMVQRGKMPPSAHEFALLDMAFSESDLFSLFRHEPGSTRSADVFFPGCQLSASAPDAVFKTYDHLRKTLTGGVGLALGCCGAPAHWAGKEDPFKIHLETVKQKWESLGKPRLILACASCNEIFLENLIEIPVISLWQILLNNGLPETASIVETTYAIHDPCTTRHRPEIQTTVRRILNQLSLNVEELALRGEKTECCGFGGLMQFANPELAHSVAERRGRQSDRDYITYCAMCRDNFAKEGKRAVHLLDLFFSQKGNSDPAARKHPSWSDRLENRERLRERFLRSCWKEPDPTEKAPHRSIVLKISSEVASLLDNRRILREDIQRLLYAALETGRVLFKEETGRYLAAFKPVHVTFWVEYTPGEGEYIIHNAYSHRMEVESG